MSQQKELSIGTFVGITLVVLAFLFVGPCVSNPTGNIYIEPETVLEVGRETLLEHFPGAIVIEEKSFEPGLKGKNYGYEAKYRLKGDNTIYRFYAEGDQ